MTLTSMDPLNETIRSYNNMAEEYCKITSEKGDREFQKKMLDLTLDYLPKDARILDIGCGDGRDSYYLSRKDIDVVGIDLSKSMVELARKKYPDLAFFKEDMRDTVFPDDTFHGVWASLSIINMPKSELSTIESEIFRILGSDGIFAFSVKKGEGEGFEDNNIVSDHPRYFSYYTLDELKNKLRLFEMIDSHEYPGKLFGDEFLYCWAKVNR
ncbi:MAG: class I SAM-dependent methyltransferase [Candidatus Saliniplasma sp.]